MTADYITITTVEPYTTRPAVPIPTGHKTIWATYIVGCLAAHPTTYAATCPDEMVGDPDDWTVSHLPTGGALALYVSARDARRLVDAWQAVPLAGIDSYAAMAAVKSEIGPQLRAAAVAIGLDWPGMCRR